MNELEEERDHLLRSLDDLEQEYAAGDVDAADYEALKDDYTARAAAVIRDIEAHRAAPAPRPPRRWGRTLGWTVAVAVFAVLAGVLVARMSGSRRDSETATGDVRDNTRELIADATSAAQRGEYDDAIELYGDALELSPSSAEALAYRGWARYRKGGDDEAARADLDAATEADGAYADARVFKAVVLADQGDFEGAAAELDVFDSLDPPAVMQQIVASFALRERIVAGVLLADGAPTYTEAGFSADEVLAAARYTFSQVPVEALGLIDQVVAAEPANADARADRGYLLGLVAQSATGQADLRDRALGEIEAALDIDPQNAPALAYEAIVRYFLFDDEDGARAALARFDAVGSVPDYVSELLASSGLRDELAG